MILLPLVKRNFRDLKDWCKWEESCLTSFIRKTSYPNCATRLMGLSLLNQVKASKTFQATGFKVKYSHRKKKIKNHINLLITINLSHKLYVVFFLSWGSYDWNIQWKNNNKGHKRILCKGLWILAVPNIHLYGDLHNFSLLHIHFYCIFISSTSSEN